MFNLEEELKKLPDKPGVYLMHDKQGNIIYVGKAKILKNRVRQYFQSDKNKSLKIRKMVTQIAWFEYIVVDSEIEALVLECNLIKEYRPKYNTMLMDDKAYPFIKITTKEDFPRVIFAHHQKNDKARYFGPYTNGGVKETLDILRKIYCFRSCAKRIPGDKTARPCLYYELKQCKAPCCGLISKEDYAKIIDGVTEFLNGKFSPVTSMLESKMLAASEALEFEEAAEYRDLLACVKKISEKQKITDMDNSNRDVIALASTGEEAVVQVFFIRSGKMVGREHFHLSNVNNETRRSIMTSFIKQYYASSPSIPKELLLGEEIDDEQLISEWLTMKRGLKVHILIPKKGMKERLVMLAEKNASMVLQQDSEKLKREEDRTLGALRTLAEYLKLDKIRRVEAYDISNTSGFESVGSMIVFEDGKAKKNAYRKFKIKTVQGPNDYASLKEVLTRRIRHGRDEAKELAEKGIDISLGSFTVYPDLILMDGGKGQVNIALEVMQETGVDIPVCGMVKDDNHRTRGLFYNNEELPISPSSEVFRLITRIQDETHRFAIEYHRSLRGKAQVRSILDDIDGIGPQRRRALMKYFKSIEAVREATVEELAGVPSMNRAAAEQVKSFFSAE